MNDRSERVRAIREFILSNVADHPGDIARLMAERFHISRATAANHIGALVREGFSERLRQHKGPQISAKDARLQGRGTARNSGAGGGCRMAQRNRTPAGRYSGERLADMPVRLRGNAEQRCVSRGGPKCTHRVEEDGHKHQSSRGRRRNRHIQEDSEYYLATTNPVMRCWSSQRAS